MNFVSCSADNRGSAMASFSTMLTVIALFSSVDFTGADVTLPQPSGQATTGTTIRPWCSVTGETFVGWYNSKGGKIPTDNSQRKHVETLGDKHYLVIKHVKPTDGGVYQCRGNLKSASWALNIGFVATPPPQQKLALDKSGVIHLDAHGYPTPTYKWKKNGVALDPANDPRMTLREDGSINISTVKISDEATYVCDIEQQALFTSKTVTITVSVIKKPVITLKPKATRILTEGFNTTFKCNATGRPQPTITWIDNLGRTIDGSVDSRYLISDGFLTITGVLKKDTEKSYTCQAKNAEDDAEAMAVITKVLVAPKLKALSDKTVNEEDKVVLICEGEAGDVPMVVEWKKDGIKVSNQEIKDLSSTIVYEKVVVENSGKYICEASNEAKDEKGKQIVVQEEVNLFVKSPPRLNKQKSTSPLYSFVGNQNPVKIVCEFFGYPLPNITMTKNGTEVMAGQKTVTYEIKKTEEQSFGTFHCLATNKNGNESHTVELKKAVAPGGVKNLKSVGSCKSIKVMWEKPNFDGGLPITLYDVKIKDENDTEVTAESVYAPTTLSILTEGIEKKKLYEISVSARSAFPQRGAVRTTTIATKKYCVPSKPVIKNDVSKPLAKLKLKLTWTRPDNDGGDPVIRYKITYQSYLNGILQENKTIGETTKLEMDVDDYLVAGRTYTFRIMAINEAGESSAGVLQFKVSSSAENPEAEGGTKEPVNSAVIAAIVIVIILVVLVVIDLLCCYYNNCGVFFCFRMTCCPPPKKKKNYELNRNEKKRRSELEKLKKREAENEVA